MDNKKQFEHDEFWVEQELDKIANMLMDGQIDHQTANALVKLRTQQADMYGRAAKAPDDKPVQYNLFPTTADLIAYIKDKDNG